jgi:hypothetical protein
MTLGVHTKTTLKMEVRFAEMKMLLEGEWRGEGMAKFPTIEDTQYTEVCIFTPDEDKDSIHFDQKTIYKNNTEKKWENCFLGHWFYLTERKQSIVGECPSGRSNRNIYDGKLFRRRDNKNYI